MNFDNTVLIRLLIKECEFYALFSMYEHTKELCTKNNEHYILYTCANNKLLTGIHYLKMNPEYYIEFARDDDKI